MIPEKESFSAGFEPEKIIDTESKHRTDRKRKWRLRERTRHYQKKTSLLKKKNSRRKCSNLTNQQENGTSIRRKNHPS